MAASTWCHTPCRRAIAPASATGSTAMNDVVPTVEVTRKGRRPAARSASTAAASAAGASAAPRRRRPAGAGRRRGRRGGALLHRRVGVDGRVGPQPAPSRPRVAAGGVVAGGDGGDEGRRRGGVLDHPAAATAVVAERGGQAEELDEPVAPPCSSSVDAGEVAHSIPCWPRAAVASSPSTAAGLELPGKYARNRGDCQCVTAGTTTRSRSASRSAQARGPGAAAAARGRGPSPGDRRHDVHVVERLEVAGAPLDQLVAQRPGTRRGSGGRSRRAWPSSRGGRCRWGRRGRGRAAGGASPRWPPRRCRRPARRRRSTAPTSRHPPRRRRPGPELLAVDLVEQQLGDGDEQDGVDLGRVGDEPRGRSGSTRRTGR